MEKSEKKFRLTGCPAVKAAVFFLMLVSAVAAIAGCSLVMICVDIGLYTENREEAVRNALRGKGAECASRVWRRWDDGEEKEAARYLKGTNMEVAIRKDDFPFAEELDPAYVDDGVCLWQSYESREPEGGMSLYSDLYLDYGFESGYVIRVFFDPAFPKEDGVRETYLSSMRLYDWRYAFCCLAAGGILLFVFCLAFLLRAAGRRNGREGIVPMGTTRLPFEVFTALLLFLLAVVESFLNELGHGTISYEVADISFVAVSGLLSFGWLYDLAIRLKLGNWWKNTICYSLFSAMRKAAVHVGKGLRYTVREIPLVWKTIVVYLAVCLPELALLCLRAESEEVSLWCFWKLLLLAAVLCVALMCKELLKASRELAAGNEAYRVDTGKMFGELREHGENLNSLGKGISRAVAERMKSEHLKTELITNVSHDIKTPLTSIINYADLLGSLPEAAASEEQDGQCIRVEREKFREYTEVLLRQSRKLKKLLEDLVEASKATTGNLEVKLEPCEVGVLLTQAVGEYQQRMAERGLELRDSQPETPVEILADGRRLWRVFDNLLNNICKYAQENSRVYLSLEQREDKVDVVFRNMSKYALDVTPEELEERFVRGDKSRHKEGNGLGLSIAKSLTELQNGEMKIVIDGDLFKVTLTFPALSGEVHETAPQSW